MDDETDQLLLVQVQLSSDCGHCDVYEGVQNQPASGMGSDNFDITSFDCDGNKNNVPQDELNEFWNDQVASYLENYF